MRGAFLHKLLHVPARKRVYVDETGVTTSMTRLFGRAAPGQRVCDAVPLERWTVTTLVAALRLKGPAAPLTLEGSIDGLAFETYVEQCLCPTLREGDVVIMDRLQAHLGLDVQRTIEAMGAKLLCLPPYSPDLNPIEGMWSKVKEHLRAVKPRTQEELIDTISDALHSVSAADARGYFRHRGGAVRHSSQDMLH